MASLRERIENNLPIFFLATLATGFAAGFGTYKAIQEASNVVPVKRAEYEQLVRDAKKDPPTPSRRTSDTTGRTAPVASTGGDTERPLDGTVPVISASQCWEYVAQPVSIGGRLFETYAVIDHRCSKNEALTFDVRGWTAFEGWAGVVESDSRANNLSVKTDGQETHAIQVFYNRAAIELKVDLTGHSTLTFEKSDRYPLVVIGNPKLSRS